MPRANARRRAPRETSLQRQAPPARLPQDTQRAEIQVYAIPGVAILPLRAFLGVTLIYGGLQKLTDPGFFTLGSSTYIGTQIVQFSHNSPIKSIMQRLAEHAVAVGWLTICTEIAIGTLIVLGLFTRLAALGGFVLNFVFFLTASWNVYPYFLGSDIVFVAAWLTVMLTGPGAYALDPLVAGPLRRRVGPTWERIILGSFYPWRQDSAPEPAPIDIVPGAQEAQPRSLRVSRREAAAGGLVAAGLFILGLAPRVKFGSSAASGARAASGAVSPPTAPAAAQPTVPAGAPRPTAPPTSAPPAPSGKLVANISQIPVNSGLPTTDPKSGDPAVIVHTTGSDFYAYDAVCTHAGCTVQYDPQYKLLVCPCHGGAYDPTQNGAVVAGPPPTPLTKLPIQIDSKGNVYLT